MKLGFRLPADIREKVKSNITHIEDHIRRLPKIWLLRSRKREEEFLRKIAPNLNKLNELGKKYPCGEFSALYNSMFNKIDALKLRTPPARRETIINPEENVFASIKNKVSQCDDLYKNAKELINSKDYIKEHMEINVKDLNNTSVKCKEEMRMIETLSEENKNRILEAVRQYAGNAEIKEKVNTALDKLEEERDKALKSVDRVNGLIKEAKSNIFKTDRVYTMVNSLNKNIDLLKKSCESGKAYSTEIMSSSKGILNMARNTKEEVSKELELLDNVVGGKQYRTDKLNELSEEAEQSLHEFKVASEGILESISPAKSETDTHGNPIKIFNV